MLDTGRLPLNEAERKAVDRIMAEHESDPVSLTRRDPGETGPLLVHAGDTTYEVSEAGRRKKKAAG